MNNVNLVGNVTSDYRVNEFTDKEGKKQIVVNGSIAVNEIQGNGKDVTTFVNITAFRGKAKVLKDYTVKGSKIAISGPLRQDTYEKDGKTQYRYYVLVSNLDLLDTKEQTEQKREGTNNKATNVNNNYNDKDIPPENNNDLPY